MKSLSLVIIDDLVFESWRNGVFFSTSDRGIGRWRGRRSRRGITPLKIAPRIGHATAASPLAAAAERSNFALYSPVSFCRWSLETHSPGLSSARDGKRLVE